MDSIDNPLEKIRVPSLIHKLLLPLLIVIQIANTLAICIMLAISYTLRFLQIALFSLPYCKTAWTKIVTWYHDWVQLLADNLLEDPRDEPILACVIGLTLTALPVLIIQLALGELNYGLVLLFYAFIYGANIRSFVRSFSAMHQDGHKPGGVFKGGSWCEKATGNSFTYCYLAIFRGIIPHSPAHTQQHHRENTSPKDVYVTEEFDHTNPWHFMKYMVNEVIYQQLMITPYIYFKKNKQIEQMRCMVMGNTVYFLLFTALALFDLKIAFFYMAVPWFASNFLMGVIHWCQHAFYGGQQSPLDFAYNTTTVLETPENFLNEGYHVCHHHPSCRHWSEAPELFIEIQDDMRRSKSIVFKDLSTMDLYLLLMLKRYKTLAKKLSWWDDVTEEDKIAILKSRVRPTRYEANGTTNGSTNGTTTSISTTAVSA
ncbi:fatty acid desaturase [Aurantivibrio plasticivorans]